MIWKHLFATKSCNFKPWNTLPTKKSYLQGEGVEGADVNDVDTPMVTQTKIIPIQTIASSPGPSQRFGLEKKKRKEEPGDEAIQTIQDPLSMGRRWTSIEILEVLAIVECCYLLLPLMFIKSDHSC